MLEICDDVRVLRRGKVAGHADPKQSTEQSLASLMVGREVTNQMNMVTPIGRMTTYRLLEMLTGSEQVYDQQIRESAREIDQQLQILSLVTQKTVDPDKIAPFLGSYHNEELGDIKLVLHYDHTLWIDFGEYESPIRPLITEENQYIFFESVFIGKTLQLKSDANGEPTMKWAGDEDIYEFITTADRSK